MIGEKPRSLLLDSLHLHIESRYFDMRAIVDSPKRGGSVVPIKSQTERFLRQPSVASAKAGIHLVTSISWIPASAEMADGKSKN